MFAPYKERVPLLNVSTFSTNVTLVEEGDLARALGAFKLELRKGIDETDDDAAA